MAFLTTVLGAVSSVASTYARHESANEDRAAIERERQRQFELQQAKQKNTGRNIALGIVAAGTLTFAFVKLRSA